MSQFWQAVTAGSLPPSVATSFVTNSGTAVPVANILNILGTTVAAGTTPFQFIGSGNTVTGQIQRAQAIAASNSTNIGLAAFDSSSFAVDANGFVTLVGGGEAIDSVNVQAGTTPIVPAANGSITVNGAAVAAHSIPVQSNGTGVNTFQIEVQRANAAGASVANNAGIASFNVNDFSVDANGYVSIISGGMQWIDVTSATQVLAAQTGYFTDRGAGVSYSLPASAVAGDLIKIDGKLGLTTITQAAGQQILMGANSSTAGATGSVVGTNVGDCISLRCITTGAGIWRGENWVGNFTLN